MYMTGKRTPDIFVQVTKCKMQYFGHMITHDSLQKNIIVGMRALGSGQDYIY